MNIVQLKDGTGDKVYAVSHTNAIKVNGEQKTLTTKLADDTDIYNVTEHVPLDENEYYELSTAIGAVPSDIRKPGLVITYLNEDSIWKCYQYTLEDTTNTSWVDESNWGPFGGASYATTSAEVANMSDDLNIVKLHDEDENDAYTVSHSDAIKVYKGETLTDLLYGKKVFTKHQKVSTAYLHDEIVLDDPILSGKTLLIQFEGFQDFNGITLFNGNTFTNYYIKEPLEGCEFVIFDTYTLLTKFRIYKSQLPNSSYYVDINVYVLDNSLQLLSRTVDELKQQQNKYLGETILDVNAKLLSTEGTTNMPIKLDLVLGEYLTVDHCYLDVYCDTEFFTGARCVQSSNSFFPSDVVTDTDNLGFYRIPVTDEITFKEIRLYPAELPEQDTYHHVKIVKTPEYNLLALDKRITDLKQQVDGDFEDVVIYDGTKPISAAADSSSKDKVNISLYNTSQSTDITGYYARVTADTYYEIQYDSQMIENISFTYVIDLDGVAVSKGFIKDEYGDVKYYSGENGIARFKFDQDYILKELRLYAYPNFVGLNTHTLFHTYNTLTTEAFDFRITKLEDDVEQLKNGTFGAPKIVNNTRPIETESVLSSMCLKSKDSNVDLNIKPLNILHFSDIHGSATLFLDILDFKNYYNNLIHVDKSRYPDEEFMCIDEMLHTGDSNRNQYTDEDFDNLKLVPGFEYVLNCIGNHDGRSGSGALTVWNYYHGALCYNKYFADFIDNWLVTNHPENTCYYYKDYDDLNIRLIVLDENDFSGSKETPDYTDLTTWFLNALNDARSNNIHVVVATHSIVTKTDDTGPDRYLTTPVRKPIKTYEYDSTTNQLQTSIVNEGDRCSFSKIVRPSGPQTMFCYKAAADAVNAFIQAGGTFVCWLCGHCHYTDIGFATDYPNQLLVCVDAAKFDQSVTDQDVRVLNTSTEYSFLIVSIDTVKGYLTLLKVGTYYDKFMRDRFTLCYDYINHKLISDGGEYFDDIQQ